MDPKLVPGAGLEAQLLEDFPALGMARDAPAVAAAIARCGPDWFPRVGAQQAEIGKQYVKPKKHVRLVYHFYTDPPVGSSPVHVWAVGKALHRKKVQSAAGGHPQRYLSIFDGGLLIEPFTQDEDLPEIPQLIRPEWAVAYFGRHREEFGLGPAPAIDAVTVEPLKYNPGKRMVLRYTLHLGHDTLRTYAKYYSDDRGEISAGVQSEVSRLLRLEGRDVSVPGVYRYDAALRVVFQQDWGGEPLKKRCPRLTDRATWRRVLDATATLHRIPVPSQVVERRSAADLLRGAGGDVQDISSLRPELQAELEGVYLRLQHLLEAPAEEPQGFVHGSLLLSQILVRPDQIGFIDFDSTAIGDPLYDVSEMLASSLFERWRTGADLEGLDRFHRAALEDYAAVYGYRPSTPRACGYILAFLLGKTHQHLKGMKPLPDGGTVELRRLLGHFSRTSA